MITDENKWKFINGESIQLECGYHIRSKSGCNYKDGSIWKLSNIIFQDYTCIEIYFDENDAHRNDTDNLFLSTTYDFVPKFSRMGSEYRFHNLKQNIKDEILEYASWITSDNGINYVKTMDDKLGMYK